MSFTALKPLRFKKLLSVVGVAAVFFSEGCGTVINGDPGSGVDVTSGFRATGPVLDGRTSDGANACATAIWVPHIATANQVDMCSSFMVDPSQFLQ